jgi:hypothetical protein
MSNFVNYLDSLSDEQKALLPGDLLMDNNFQPTNRNKLTTNRFLFNMTRTPYLAYFCQRVNIPSLGFGTSIQSNPTAIEIKRPGTRLIYEDLQIGFIVDEEMKNWLEIHNWLKKISTYDTVYDYLKEEQKTASALLYVMSAAYKPLLSIYFHDIYPTFLSSIDFDSTSPDSENIISTVTFSYTYYEIKQGEA